MRVTIRTPSYLVARSSPAYGSKNGSKDPHRDRRQDLFYQVASQRNYDGSTEEFNSPLSKLYRSRQVNSHENGSFSLIA